MPEININFLAVLVAAVSSMLVGAFWYSPFFFGKKWMALMGFTDESEIARMKQGVGKKYVLTFFSALVTSYVLAQIINITKSFTLGKGIQAGFWLWLGFVATTSLSSWLFEKRPAGLYLLNNFYHLVSFWVMGIILALWR